MNNMTTSGILANQIGPFWQNNPHPTGVGMKNETTTMNNLINTWFVCIPPTFSAQSAIFTGQPDWLPDLLEPQGATWVHLGDG